MDYSDLGHVGVSLDASRGADQDLYDSLFHSHAAVGLNTSAMLEAAIVGRPVHTLVIPGFDEGQVGTMHFHYLVEAYGGLATDRPRSSPSITAQLSQVLARTARRRRPAAAAFARAVPAAARHRSAGVAHPDRGDRAGRGAIVKRPRASAPFWHAPLRAALLWCPAAPRR